MNVRRLAVEALQKILDEGAYSNLTIHAILTNQKEYTGQESGFLTELVYGTLQHKLAIEYYFAPLLVGKKLKPWMRTLLLVSGYQLVYLPNIPQHAVLDEATKIAQQKGDRQAGKFVTAILRKFLREPRPSLDAITDPLERLSVETSHPIWIVKLLAKQYDVETAALICRNNNLPPLKTARVNRLKSTTLDERFSAGSLPMSVVLTKGNIGNTTEFSEGYLSIQDEASMQVAPLLDPKPGERILDMCAAPGGKTCHIAELMNNEGVVIANDVHEHKLTLIANQAERLGITCIEPICHDATTLASVFPKASFDRILVDAPCSGLGVIRRKPEIRYNIKPQDLDSLLAIQHQLLETALELIKPDGIIVYSTCTINKKENEKQLEQLSGVEIIEQKQFTGADGQTDGFYMSKLKINR
ncbi:MAG: 16S rRNA (cytosine(967)-C(5))-methyltransferase RsmB [Culicoidibacterales bacterium]